MNYKKQLGKNLAALSLLIALMLPAAIQFFHLLEGTEHLSCTIKTTHIHKPIKKCEMCVYHMAFFVYSIAEYSDLILPKIPVEGEINYASLPFFSFTSTNTQLRAPPTFS